MNNLNTLELASALDAVNIYNSDSLLAERAARAAAIELLRLHDLNNELIQALKNISLWAVTGHREKDFYDIEKFANDALELVKEAGL